jgi:hypothetical protein
MTGNNSIEAYLLYPLEKALEFNIPVTVYAWIRGRPRLICFAAIDAMRGAANKVRLSGGCILT